MSGSFSVSPMSNAQFQGAGAATGAGSLVEGLTTLGQTIAGGPVRQAQGAYLGAETGRAHAQTQDIQRRLAAGEAVKSIMANPNFLNDPSAVRTLAGVVGAYPEMAQALPRVLGAMVAGSVQGGQMSPSQGDAYVTRATGTPYGQTPTGQTQTLTSEEKRSGIAAGASRYVADQGLRGTIASSDATRYVSENSRKTRQEELAQDERHWSYNPDAVMGPDGKPVLVPHAQTYGMTPLSSSALTTMQSPVSGLDDNGLPSFVIPKAVPSTHPLPTGLEGEVTARKAGERVRGESGAAQPGDGGAPTAAATTATPPPLPVVLAGPRAPPVASRPGTGVGASGTSPTGPRGTVTGPLNPAAGLPGSPRGVPTTNDPVMDAIERKFYGIQQTVPSAGTASVEDAQATNAAIDTSLKTNLITPEMQRGVFAVKPDNLMTDPTVRAAILARVNDLVHGRDPLYQNKPDAAVEQAVQEILPRLSLDHGHGADADLLTDNRPTVRFKPEFQPQGAAPAPAQPNGLGPAIAGEDPSNPSSYGRPAAPVMAQQQPGVPPRTIVRAGTDRSTGQRIVQYSDGSIGPAP